MITPYAVVAGVGRRHGARPTGIGGAAVELVRHRSLVAAVSRLGRAPAPTRDAVVAHAAVCDDLMAAADAVLPVRFGTAFDGEAGLGASLDEHHDQLATALAHVRGRVEVGVRVRWPGAGAVAAGVGAEPAPAPSSPVRPGTGHEYLMARVRHEQRRRAAERSAEAVATRVDAAIRAPAADSRLEVLPAPGLVLAGAYLVDRGDVDRMVAGVRAAARDEPGLDILCTGPWPPYSFADHEVSRA